MRKRRCAEPPFIGMIEEQDARLPTAEMCRKHGLSRVRRRSRGHPFKVQALHLPARHAQLPRSAGTAHASLCQTRHRLLFAFRGQPPSRPLCHSRLPFPRSLHPRSGITRQGHAPRVSPAGPAGCSQSPGPGSSHPPTAPPSRQGFLGEAISRRAWRSLIGAAGRSPSRPPAGWSLERSGLGPYCWSAPAEVVHALG